MTGATPHLLTAERSLWCARTEQTLSRVIGPARLDALRECDEKIFEHGIRVGAALGATAYKANLPEMAQTSYMVAGGLHDVGKYRNDVILSLVRSPNVLTADQRAIVASHTTEGAQYLTRLLAKAVDPDISRYLSTAVGAAGLHHAAPRALESLREVNPGFADVVTAVQVADRADAMTDPGREYVWARLPREGLATVVTTGGVPQLCIDKEGVAAKIAGDYRPHHSSSIGLPIHELITQAIN